LEGAGSNGKTVYLAGIEGILGFDNCSFVSLEMFGERFQINSTLGKLANICGDVGELDKVAEGHIKQFTDGNPMQFERKNFATEWKADTATGAVEGYGAVFDNIDSHGDVIVRGAFASVGNNGRKVKMLWQHDPSQPIGVWDEVREDERGLYVKGRILSGVERGKEAIELMAAGAIDGLSIGYKTVVRDWRDGVRYLKGIDLFETSIVTFPSNDLAGVSLKSIETERDLERVLIDCGLSRKAAKAIAAQGKGYLALRDAADGDPDDGLRDACLIEAITKLHQSMKG